LGLSPLRLSDPVGDLSASGPGWRILPPDSPHPATLLLRDTNALDINRARVQRYISPMEPVPANLNVLLALETQAPLVVAHEFGRGRVFIQTMPINRAWSNLPVLHSYVPMVREFVWYLAGGRLSRRNIGSGDTLVLTSDGAADRPFTVKLPDGEKEQGLAEQSVMRFSNTFLPGIYQLETTSQQPPETFSVQRSAEESDLKPLTDSARALLVGNSGISFDRLGSASEAFQRSAAARQPLTETFLWLALALFVLEFLTCWLLARWRSRRRQEIPIHVLYER
jgi:hypothetical protein